MKARILAVVGVLAIACGAPPKPASPIDLEFGRLEAAARGAFDRRDLRTSSSSYLKLLNAARLTDDPSKIGDAAYNLAAVRYALGRGQEIRPLLEEADWAHGRAGRSTAEVVLLMARVELEAGEYELALEHLGTIRRDAAATDVMREQATVLAGLALVGLDRLDEAEERREALQQTARGKSKVGRPSVEHLRAQIHAARGDFADAARAFDREAELRRDLAQYGLMNHALERAGQSWLRAGIPLYGADRLYRAARSRQAQNQFEPALQLCLTALEALDEESGDPQVRALGTRLRNLFREIERADAFLLKFGSEDEETELPGAGSAVDQAGGE